MKESKDTILKEKLASVPLPDVDRAWTDMEKALDGQALTPSKSVISKLLRKPIIWLNILLLSAVVGGASISGNVQKGKSEQKIDPIERTREINFPPIFSSLILPFNSESEVNIQRLPFQASQIFKEDANDAILVNQPEKELAQFDLRSFRFGGFASRELPSGAPRHIYRAFEEVAYNKYRLLSIHADVHSGLFPEVKMNDFIRQSGFEVGIRFQPHRIWSVEASVLYNPINIRPLEFQLIETPDASITVTKAYKVHRLNYWSIRSGFRRPINQHVTFIFGGQFSALNSIYGDFTRTTNNNSVVTSNRVEQSRVEIPKGIETMDIAPYFGVDFEKGLWTIRASYMQSFKDFTQDEMLNSETNNTWVSFRVGLSRTILKKKI